MTWVPAVILVINLLGIFAASLGLLIALFTSPLIRSQSFSIHGPGPLAIVFAVSGVVTLLSLVARWKVFPLAWEASIVILAVVFYVIWRRNGQVPGLGSVGIEWLFALTLFLVIVPLMLLSRFRNQVKPDLHWVREALKVPMQLG